MEKSGKGKTIFYGWKLLAAVFVIMFFCGGFGYFVLTLFVTELEREFGWDRTVMSNMAAMCGVLSALFAPLVGTSMERFGARLTMATGALLYVMAQLVLALMTGKRMLFTGGIMAGIGLAFCTIVPGQTLMTFWFHRYRGIAMGIMMMGYGVGAVVLMPLTSLLITHAGWRWSFGVIGITVFVVAIPSILIFIRSKPSDIGFLPDGISPEEADESTQDKALSGVSVKRAVTSLAFRLLLLIYVLQIFGQAMMGLHFVPFMEGIGFTLQQGTSFWVLAIVVGITGTVLFGWLGDRFSVKRLVALVGLLFAVGVAILELCLIRLEMTSKVPLVSFAVCYGLGVGGAAPLMPMFVGWCFGQRHFSRILGLLLVGLAIGTVSGPTSAGWIFTKTGSYEIAFVICSAAFALTFILALMVSRKGLEEEFTEE